ncbi:MAG: MFS transporter [bacterium]|nr:MFS transporter [bacterium]
MPNRSPLPILFATLFAAMTGFGIVIPTLPFLATRFHLGPGDLGMLLASYSAMNVVFSPVWGRLSDRIGRRPVMIVGALGLGLSFVGYALAQAPWMLFAARLIGGVLGAALLPTAKAYAADLATDETRPRLLGILGAGLGLGMVVGPALGGVASRWFPEAPFWLAATMTLVTAALVMGALPDAPVSVRANQGILGTLRRAGRDLAPLATLSFTQMLAFTAMEATFVLFGHDRFQLDAMDIGLMFLAMGLVSAGFQGKGVGRTIERLGEMGAARIGCLALIAGFIGVPLAPSVPTLTMAFCAFGIGSALLRTSIAASAARRGTQGHGVSMGIVDASDSLARVLGPVLGGTLYARTVTLPYHAGAAVLCIALAVTWIVERGPVAAGRMD